ncbi:PstS family phosphate ABC transporter substrate-binding protein [Magnetospirillum molischianum]|uniref:Extracellular solute-binding protein, family 1 n=1 Tax=Magnetospirillum molischianum DSM 120 TaxID=1150626 RepID=H8FP93_MAGML|nr:substrate-binding domain-containing protein [Magnetospirillum molischianum]CCG40181.1 Extracellular solute-binding protein, family 1 [Magnetospirillum molischianum DSM 120]
MASNFFTRLYKITALTLLIGATSPPPQADAGTVVIGGTGSALPALRALAERFQANHPATHIEIPSSLGTNGGIRAVSAGAIDLSVSARPLTTPETTSGLRAVAWGRTPFMVVVSSQVGESAITLDGLADILAGRRTHWSNGDPITPVLRPPSDSDSTVLAAASPALSTALAAAHARPGMLIAVTDQDAAAAITGASGAIGTLTLAQKIGEGLAVKPLTLDGQTPDPAALAEGRYPLSKSYWIVTGATPSDEAREVLAYITGPKTARVLETFGIIPSP